MTMEGTPLHKVGYATFDNTATVLAVAPPPSSSPMTAEDILWKEAEARGLLSEVTRRPPRHNALFEWNLQRLPRLRELAELPADADSAMLKVLEISPHPVIVHMPPSPDAEANWSELLSSLTRFAKRLLVLDRSPPITPPISLLTAPIERYRRDQVEANLKDQALALRWANLLEWTDRLQVLEAQARQVNRSDDELRELLRRELEGAGADHSLKVTLDDCLARTADTIADLDRRRMEALAHADRQAAALAICRESMEALRPKAMARRHRRWWTLLYWRSICHTNLLVHWAELDGEAAGAEARSGASRAEAEKLQGEMEAAQKSCDASITERFLGELHSRIARRDERLAELRRECDACACQLDADWTEVATALKTDLPRPACIEDLRIYQEPWTEQTLTVRHEMAWAEGWLKRLAELPPDAALLRLMRCVPRLDLSLETWRQYVGMDGPPQFDCVVLHGIESPRAADLAALPLWADRLLWVGDAEAIHAHPNQRVAGRRGQATDTPRFADLYSTLADMRPWRRGPQYLTVAIETRTDRRLDWEPLADCPDIEIGIEPPARNHPARLVAVRFPAEYPFARAKCVLFEQLQAITLQTSSPGYRVDSDPDSFTVRFFDRPAEHNVPLGKGIVEDLAGLETVAVRFDRKAGWNLQAIRAWLAMHLLDRPMTHAFSRVGGAAPA